MSLYSEFRPRFLKRVSNPALEPLSLTDVKLFLRIDDSSEDSLINNLIVTAREAAEEYLKRSLINQSWKLIFDEYSPYHVFLPRGPVQSVTSVKTIARDLSEVTVNPETYFLRADKDYLEFDICQIAHQIEILYNTGYGAGASDVPSPIKQGMLNHIALLYDDRGGAEIPAKARALYSPFRVITL